MQMRKAFYISGIWFLPAVLIFIESLIFLPKTLRNSDFIPYFIVFWTVRAVLSPFVVYYTFRLKIEYTRIFRQFLVHLLGFLLFSVLFWTISFILLRNIMYENPVFNIARSGTDLGVFSLIADNSISTNIVVYVSTVAFCYVWEFFRRTTEANKRAGDLERSLLVSRLELLKGQLNSHFLFNSLNNISSLVVRNKNEEANRVLVKLSELLRFSLRENKEQLIPLDKEMEILQLYLDIQKTRFNDRLDVEIDFPKTLGTALVPPMILQPIVENAVKYAIEPYREKGKISIKISEGNDNINVSVSDTGPVAVDPGNLKNGIGLTNTRERLEQLYGNKHSFTILPNQDKGTNVTIGFPKQWSENGKS